MIWVRLIVQMAIGLHVAVIVNKRLFLLMTLTGLIYLTKHENISSRLILTNNGTSFVITHPLNSLNKEQGTISFSHFVSAESTIIRNMREGYLSGNGVDQDN